MEEECPICRIHFDLDLRTPMILCPEQHLCCSECVNQILQTQHNPSCPECRHPLSQRNIRKFRHFQAFSQIILKLKRQVEQSQQQKRRIQQILKQSRSCQNLQKQARNISHLPKVKKTYAQNSSTFKHSREHFNIKHEQDNINSKTSLKHKVEKHLHSQDYGLAILLLMSAIEKYPSCSDQVFIGFGCREQQKDFCEDRNYQWYKKRYPNIDISFEDLLALCFLKKPDFSMQKQWYGKMVQNYPYNHRIRLGLAFTYHNQGDLANAFDLYLQLIEKQPVNSKPYEMLAFIYFAKNEMELANKYSNLCLKLQPTNIYASLIYALSNKFQYKIALRHLVLVLIYQPTYKRARKAIFQIFKSCFYQRIASIIQSSIQRLLQLTSKGNTVIDSAIQYYKNGNYQQCILTLQKLMRTNSQQSVGKFDDSLKLLGCAYFMRMQYQLSSKYFSTANKRGGISLYLGINNFMMGSYEEAKRSIKIYIQHCRINKLQKEISKRHIQFLNLIMYYSSNALKDLEAGIYYPIWLNRYFSKPQINEKQLALYYWKNLLDVNRPNNITKRLFSQMELIMTNYDSFGFLCKSLKEFN